METGQALRRTKYMWAKLGRALEANAYKRTESGSGLDLELALKFARAAEACFWQATGDCKSFSLSELL